MATLQERIVNTLEELGNEEFETFKWYLKQSVNLQQAPRQATRTYTADRIVQTYAGDGGQIMVNVLKKIHRNDLVRMFPSIGTEPVLAVPAQQPPAVHQVVQHVAQEAISNQATTVTLTHEQLSNIRSTFLCIICQDVMRNPVVAPCCRSLIGCRVCVAQWTRNTPTCPKCRNEAFPDSLFEITGMEGVIAALRDTIRN